MKYNDLRIQNEVLRALRKHYSFTIASAEFIPMGEESYAYIISIPNGKKYFIKYCERKQFVANIEKVNKLLLQLHHFDFVVPPIVVHGQTSFEVKEGKITVYPYISGTVVNTGNDKFDKNLVNKLTNVVSKIHNATLSTAVDLPKEAFSNNYLKRLEMLLSETTRGKLDNIRKLLLQNTVIIHDIIKTHNALANKFKKQKPQFALTHGDITGLNIIIFAEGIKLTDWDDAMFAPAERDLNFFVDNQHFSLQKYQALTGLKEYHPKLREYYGQRWALDSIIGNFESIAKGEKSKANKSEYIEEIKEYLEYLNYYK